MTSCLSLVGSGHEEMFYSVPHTGNTNAMALNVLLFLGYTLASVAGLIILKMHLGPAREFVNGQLAWSSISLVAVGAALYIAGFVFWLGILLRMDLSLAYPIAVALTLVFSSLAGWLLLNEMLSASRLLGIMVIFAGIVIVTRS